jgi:hypothetical protein
MRKVKLQKCPHCGTLNYAQLIPVHSCKNCGASMIPSSNWGKKKSKDPDMVRASFLIHEEDKKLLDETAQHLNTNRSALLRYLCSVIRLGAK